MKYILGIYSCVCIALSIFFLFSLYSLNSHLYDSENKVGCLSREYRNLEDFAFDLKNSGKNGIIPSQDIVFESECGLVGLNVELGKTVVLNDLQNIWNNYLSNNQKIRTLLKNL